MTGAPTGVPTVGWPFHLQALTLWRDPVGSLGTWARHHGDVFSLDLPAVGGVVVVGDPAGAHDLLRGDPSRAAAGAATGRVLPLLGSSCVLRLDGDAHLARRRILNPVFHGDILSRHRESIVEIVRRELAGWPVGRPVRSLGLLQDLTFAVIARLVLGLTDRDAVSHLHRLVRRATGPAALAGTWMWPLRPGRLQDRARAIVGRRQRAVTDSIAETVRRRIEGHPGDDDALQALLVGGDGSPSGPGLYEELRALLVVGHETTAAALAWGLERLVREPAVLARLAHSVEEGDAGYLDAVIFEVLRWRPPVIDTVRELTEPMEIANHSLAAGTLAMVSPYLVHQHRELFASPAAFVPDRFAQGSAPDPRAWVPFGGGSRRCVGAELAVVEMEVVLAELLAAFTLHPATRSSERARLAGTVLVPAEGASVLLSPRAFDGTGGSPSR